VIEVFSTPCPNSSIALANFFPVLAQDDNAWRCSFQALNSSSINLTFLNVSSWIACVPLPNPGSLGDGDREVLIEVALLDFGMARDAFDGELWPNNGISLVWRIVDEVRKRVDSCREGSVSFERGLCVCL
jgi:hypothetical protein